RRPTSRTSPSAPRWPPCRVASRTWRTCARPSTIGAGPSSRCSTTSTVWTARSPRARSTRSRRSRGCSGARSGDSVRRAARSWPSCVSTRPRWRWCPARRSARRGSSACPTPWRTTTWSRASPGWLRCSPRRKTDRSAAHEAGGARRTTAVARVLVTEKIAQSGLDLLADAGHEVDVREGLSPEELLDAIVGAHALIIRSATQVTGDVLAAGSSLQVVGRAGVGLDNVDVTAAPERGVMVVNAPTSNILSVAEQAMALMLAQARNIPQADAALKAGRWERSKWEGVELHGKVLGVVGLGRAGSLVAQRAHAFGMELIGFDPFVSQDRARAMGVRLVSIEELVAEADFVSIHTPKTPETMGLFGKDLLAKCKPGIRIVNTARGGIVDEDALADAIRAGIVR